MVCGVLGSFVFCFYYYRREQEKGGMCLLCLLLSLSLSSSSSSLFFAPFLSFQYEKNVLGVFHLFFFNLLKKNEEEKKERVYVLLLLLSVFNWIKPFSYLFFKYIIILFENIYLFISSPFRGSCQLHP